MEREVTYRDREGGRWVYWCYSDKTKVWLRRPIPGSRIVTCVPWNDPRYRKEFGDD